MKTLPYKWLAEYYDQFFSAQRPIFQPAKDIALGKILPGVKVACDLACGTGVTVLDFARKGIRMYGVDLSPGMCRVAREKAHKAGVKAKIIRSDMRTFQLPERVDLVISEFDAVNHVPEKSDLTAVAKSVAAALKPGGYFFFDVNTKLAFREIWHLTWFQERPGVVLVMNSGYDEKEDPNRAWSDVSWFFQEGKMWRRQKEYVEEVCWSNQEVLDTLRASGFDKIKVWDSTAFYQHAYIPKGARRYYLARRA